MVVQLVHYAGIRRGLGGEFNLDINLPLEASKDSEELVKSLSSLCDEECVVVSHAQPVARKSPYSETYGMIDFNRATMKLETLTPRLIEEYLGIIKRGGSYLYDIVKAKDVKDKDIDPITSMRLYSFSANVPDGSEILTTADYNALRAFYSSSGFSMGRIRSLDEVTQIRPGTTIRNTEAVC
ncbi:MAG: hypothetical protein WCI72_03015 [archaeon]